MWNMHKLKKYRKKVLTFFEKRFTEYCNPEQEVLFFEWAEKSLKNE